MYVVYMTEDELLAEMATVLDQLSELPDDALAERADLRARQSQLKAEIDELQRDRRSEAQKDWAQQAGRKTRTDDADPSGAIPSPSEWGGGGVE